MADARHPEARVTSRTFELDNQRVVQLAYKKAAATKGRGGSEASVRNCRDILVNTLAYLITAKRRLVGKVLELCVGVVWVDDAGRTHFDIVSTGRLASLVKDMVPDAKAWREQVENPSFAEGLQPLEYYVEAELRALGLDMPEEDLRTVAAGVQGGLHAQLVPIVSAWGHGVKKPADVMATLTRRLLLFHYGHAVGEDYSGDRRCIGNFDVLGAHVADEFDVRIDADDMTPAKMWKALAKVPGFFQDKLLPAVREVVREVAEEKRAEKQEQLQRLQPERREEVENGDVVSLQRKLAETRAELEACRGRVAYLETRLKMREDAPADEAADAPADEAADVDGIVIPAANPPPEGMTTHAIVKGALASMARNCPALESMEPRLRLRPDEIEALHDALAAETDEDHFPDFLEVYDKAVDAGGVRSLETLGLEAFRAWWDERSELLPHPSGGGGSWTYGGGDEFGLRVGSVVTGRDVYTAMERAFPHLRLPVVVEGQRIGVGRKRARSSPSTPFKKRAGSRRRTGPRSTD